MRTILFLSLTLLISCDNSESDNLLFEPNARVISLGLDCGNSYLIELDSDIENLPNSINNIFYEINLSEEYKIDGLELLVEFREPTSQELMNCSSQGSAYTQIFITEATSY